MAADESKKDTAATQTVGQTKIVWDDSNLFSMTVWEYISG